jgi:hypothetical protein
MMIYAGKVWRKRREIEVESWEEVVGGREWCTEG